MFKQQKTMKAGKFLATILLFTVFQAFAQENNDFEIAIDSTLHPIASGYDWISYRGKADISDTGGTRTCNFFMVNRTDSILYLNVHSMGIEIARIVATPDSLKYVNKLTYQYYCDTYEPINKHIPINLNFNMIQALFTGNDELLPKNKKLSFEYYAFENIDEKSSFFTEFKFKDLDRIIEIYGKMKVIKFNVSGPTSIKIPEKFERIEL